MGRRTWLSLAIGIIAVLFLAGCSSNSSSTTSGSSGMVPVSLAMHDAPPSGVSILSFEIHITGASLQPADSSAAAVSLVSAPDEIELEHLQTSSAFLSTASVPAGTYNSLSVTFANPKMTILNDSGSTLTVGSKSCANGQICEVQPPLNQASVSLSSSPFPITLSSNSPVDLNLDFNLNSSIQNDLSVKPTISVTSVSGSQSDKGDLELEMTGLVTAVDSGNQSFTLQVGTNGQTDTILTTSNTEFGFENQNCPANDFSCVATGDIVKVEAKMNNGQITATDVEGVALPQTQAVTGTVVSLNTTQNQFQMVLQDVEDSQDAQTLTLGLPVIVTVQSGATFNVNAGNLSLSNGVNFGSFANLMPGQEVSVTVSGVQTSSSGISLTTNQVTLEMSEISGTVASVNASQNTFVLSNLPSLFTSNGITQILVTVGSNTQYENTSGISSLAANQTVSISGLLTADSTTANQADLQASAVRVRN
jgi:hypothetical protein